MENRPPAGLKAGSGLPEVVRGLGTGEEQGGDRSLTCSR